MPATSEVMQQLLLSWLDRLLITEGISACALLSWSLPLASPLYNLFLNDTGVIFPDGEKTVSPYALLKYAIHICNPENTPRR